MPRETQAVTPESVVSVDLNAADDSKAVTRSRSDIASGVRDDATDGDGRTKSERELFKRMNRLERNLRKEFSQKEADREAEHNRQISELRGQLDRVSLDKGGAADAADAAHDAAIKVIRDKIEAAMEKGDSKAVADLTMEMSRLDAQFWAKKATAAGQVVREQGERGTTQAQVQAAKTTGPTRAGSRFIGANDWWDDPEYEAEQAYANAAFIRLTREEGFDPKSQETFKEVSKLLKSKFPSLDVHSGAKEVEADADEDTEEVREQRQERRPAANTRIDDRGPAGAGNRAGVRTLTAADRATMQACRLDPDNDAHVVQYMREAAQLERA